MTFQRTLTNGLTLLHERRAGPGFTLELRVPAGAALDPVGLEGGFALLEEWLYKGAGDLSARELADAFDDLGLRRGGSVTHEAMRFSVSGLTADLPRAADLLAQVLRRPALPEADLEVIADLARQDLEALADSPADLLGVRVREAAFRPPYAHAVGGTAEGLANATAPRVRALHGLLGPSGAALAVVGDVSADAFEDLALACFGDWEGGAPPLPHVIFEPGQSLHVPDDTEQTHLNLLLGAVGPRDPRWPLLHVTLGVLSGGSAARLFEEIREQRGLAYSVSASGHAVGGEGFVWVYAGSTPARAQETLDVILALLSGLERGVTEAEFERARAGLLASTVFASESTAGRTRTLARDWLTLGRVRSTLELQGEVRAVTLQDVNAFLASRPLSAPTIATLGPQPLLTGGAHVPA